MKRFLANYVFVFIPFLVLMGTKLLIEKPEEILTSTDWSVVSFIIFAQSMSLIVGESAGQRNLSKDGLQIFIAINIILMLFCLFIYANVTAYQTYGWLQVVLFIVASLWMFICYVVVDKLKERPKTPRSD